MVVEPLRHSVNTDVFSVTLDFTPEQYQLLQAVSVAAGRSIPDAIRYGLSLLQLYDQTRAVGGRMLTEVGGRIQEILSL